MSYLAQQILSIPLEGSERQLVWGRSLRSQKVGFFTRIGNRAVLREIEPLLVEDEVRQMRAFTPQGLGWLATFTVIQACSCADARFWIDKREEDPITWLKAAYGDVLLHLLHHPFPEPHAT